MTLRRHLLPWDAPVTRRVREFLLPEAPAPTAYRAVNLQDTLVVVPTRQAARRLSAELVQHCAKRGVALLSSRIVPPTFFLQPEHPDPRTASATLAAATWAHVLETLQSAEHAAAPPPPGPDFVWALQTGRVFQELRQTLSDAGLCLADVSRRLGDALEERERWEALASLEERYLAALAALGFTDPLAARIACAQAPTLPEGVRRVVVACLPDPSLLLISSLQALADRADVTVDVLIHADPADAATFDTWGHPNQTVWHAREIRIPDPAQNIHLAATPAAQSAAAVSLLQPRATLPSFNFAIGVPDSSVTPYLAAALADAGLQAFDPADEHLSDHPLYSLLNAFADLAADDRYAALSRLLRHPDLLAYLAERHRLRARDLLTELDRLQNTVLPPSLSAVTAALRHAAPTSGQRDPYPSLRHAIACLDTHLAAVRQSPSEPALRDFLQDVYAARSLRRGIPMDAEFEAAAQEVDRALRELGDASAAPALHTYTQALRLLDLRLTAARFHPAPTDADLDLEGWLELPWNDAPGLIVTGMNEGCVPDTRLGDPFLPDALRAKLGLRDDAARLARDTYLMSAMIASRAASGAVHFIVGKTSAQGDPLKPSRLLFRCADTELRARALQLFGPTPTGRHGVPASISFTLTSAPPPDVARHTLPIRRLSVTSFRNYLACPFRFYLRQVFGMEPLDDSVKGIDALTFGTMIHHVLQRMAESGEWRATDEARLHRFLTAELDAWIADRYGSQPPLALTLAVASAGQRLAAAARIQVAMARDGWEILHSERKRVITLGGIEISGKIDRVDRHRDTGRLRVIDYKTSDGGDTPRKTHLTRAHPDTPPAMLAGGAGNKRWIDLQLPLYVALLDSAPPVPTEGTDSAPHRAVRSAPLPTDIEVGYFNLPKATADTGFSAWDDFDRRTVASALACAEEVIARIHANIFWPPAENIPADWDDFAPLFPGRPSDCITPPFPDISGSEVFT